MCLRTWVLYASNRLAADCVCGQSEQRDQLSSASVSAAAKKTNGSVATGVVDWSRRSNQRRRMHRPTDRLSHSHPPSSARTSLRRPRRWRKCEAWFITLTINERKKNRSKSKRNWSTAGLIYRIARIGLSSRGKSKLKRKRKLPS